MPLRSNMDTVKRLYDMFNHRRWRELEALYADNTFFLDNKIGDRYVAIKRQDLLSRIAALERKYPGLSEKILYIEESGDQVYVQYITSGISRTGETWTQIAWNIFTIEEGKITKVATYFSSPE